MSCAVNTREYFKYKLSIISSCDQKRIGKLEGINALFQTIVVTKRICWIPVNSAVIHAHMNMYSPLVHPTPISSNT